MTVANVLPDDIFQGPYAEMVSRLATKEWFTARISAAALIPASYDRFTSEHQTESIKHFAALCRDDTPMVRRVASQHLGDMFRTVIDVGGRSTLEEEGSLSTQMMPLYEELASNEQPVSSLC